MNFIGILTLAVVGLGGFLFLPILVLVGAVLTIPATIIAMILTRPRVNDLKSALAAIATSPNLEGSKFIPRVLIVEDDLDAANALKLGFQQQGYEADVSAGMDKAHRLLASNNYDLIVLDWLLGGNQRGDRVIKKASQLIDHISSLKARFANSHRTKIVTCSSLRGQDLEVPQTKYFEHYAHWRKPMSYRDIQVRAAEMLAVSGA